MRYATSFSIFSFPPSVSLSAYLPVDRPCFVLHLHLNKHSNMHSSTPSSSSDRSPIWKAHRLGLAAFSAGKQHHLASSISRHAMGMRRAMGGGTHSPHSFSEPPVIHHTLRSTHYTPPIHPPPIHPHQLSTILARSEQKWPGTRITTILTTFHPGINFFRLSAYCPLAVTSILGRFWLLLA